MKISRMSHVALLFLGSQASAGVLAGCGEPDGADAQVLEQSLAEESHDFDDVQQVQAEDYLSMNGLFETPGLPLMPRPSDQISYVDPGDSALYGRIDFGNGRKLSQLYARVATPRSGQKVVFHIDNLQGQVFAELALMPTGPAWDTFNVQSAPIIDSPKIMGVHNVVAEFVGDVVGIGNFDWFSFERVPKPVVHAHGCTYGDLECGNLRFQYFPGAAGSGVVPFVSRFLVTFNGVQHFLPGSSRTFFVQIPKEVAAQFDIRALDGNGNISRSQCFFRRPNASSGAVFGQCPVHAN